jgi:hypothetical protein
MQTKETNRGVEREQICAIVAYIVHTGSGNDAAEVNQDHNKSAYTKRALAAAAAPVDVLLLLLMTLIVQ